LCTSSHGPLPLSLPDPLPIYVADTGGRHHRLPTGEVFQQGLNQTREPVGIELSDHRAGVRSVDERQKCAVAEVDDVEVQVVRGEDRKSTRLNSSHVKISYAVF